MLPISPPTEANLTSAAEALSAGRVVAIPTETVYGLAGDATNASAVASIYAAKGRPSTNPLIIHVHSVDAAKWWVDHSSWEPMVHDQFRIASEFWPGPLTVVVPHPRNLAPSVTAGNPSVAIRIPSHPVFLDLLGRCGYPLAAPSANPSNYVSPTRAEHVAEADLPGLAMILDGGPCGVGVESTIIRLETPYPVILRRGAVTAEQLRDVFGNVAIDEGSPAEERRTLASPGRMKKHYSPRKPLIIDVQWNASDDRSGQQGLANSAIARISFQPLPLAEQKTFGWYRSLSTDGDLAVVARALFDALRQADQSDCEAILVDSCQNNGIGAAIMDRLRRASSQ